MLTNRNKPKLPENSYPGVYKIPCDCGGNYIGQTGKQVLTRGNQHEKSIFVGKWDDSALAEHSRGCTNAVEWDRFATLSTQPNYFRRCVMEALEIQKEELGPNGNKIINDRSGLYVTTNAWKPLLNKLANNNNSLT